MMGDFLKGVLVGYSRLQRKAKGDKSSSRSSEKGERSRSKSPERGAVAGALR
jgi:hypothetical protein